MIRKVLLVDDDINITNAIRRNLRRAGENWRISFCHSTDETLALMQQESFNIIFSDIRMPGKDGFHLLRTVSESFPGVVRIIFSGHYQEESVLDAVRYAHQYMSKPIDHKMLVKTIEYICYLQDLLNNPLMEDEIGGLKGLQTLPDNYISLLREFQNDEPSLQRIAALIKNDLALTARVMQLVNSAFFGVPNHINNCEQAVALLGISNIKNLLVSSRFFNIFEGSPVLHLSVERIWRHSVKVAGLAKEIAIYERAPAKAVDACVLAGILHDIGKLILLNIPAFMNEAGKGNNQDSISSLEWEQKMIGSTHAEVGAYLLGIWGLERDVVNVVLNHHMPERQEEEQNFSVLVAVHIANYLVRVKSSGKNGVDEQKIRAYLDRYNLVSHFEAWERIANKHSD